MAVKDIFKISRKTFFSPSAWLDFDAIRAQNYAIYTIVRGLFTPDKPTYKETFAQAVERLGLTEADIKEAEDSYSAYAVVFLVITMLLLVLSFYLLFSHGTFHGWLLGLAAAALSLTMAFRYDFLAFQIKYRKLGCTIKEWKNRKIND